MSTFYRFLDFNRETYRNIRLDQVVEVIQPSGRVHDCGGVRLEGGISYSFCSVSEAERLLKALTEEIR